MLARALLLALAPFVAACPICPDPEMTVVSGSAAFPDDLQAIEIVASESDLDRCADCCPFAAITLRPAR